MKKEEKFICVGKDYTVPQLDLSVKPEGLDSK